MNLPSRGERESAATTRQIGFFCEPTRVSLSFTAIRLPLCFPLSLATGLSGCARARLAARRLRHGAWQGGHLAGSHRLHHLGHLLAALDQLVHLLQAGAAAGRDALAPR